MCRSQSLWEIRQKMGILLPWKEWGKSMLFLIPAVSYHLPLGVRPLFDSPGDGVILTLMPQCNTYGLLGTQFLDPLPVPKHTVAPGLRSSAVGGPPGPSDGEDEEETAPEAQARRPVSAPFQEEGNAPAGREGAVVELPPGRPASLGLQAGQESGDESEGLLPPLLVDEGGEESVSAPDILEDQVQKQWSFHIFK